MLTEICGATAKIYPWPCRNPVRKRGDVCWRHKPKATEQVRSGQKPIHLETDVVKRIEHFRGLKKDWDSYGAPPIQEGAITLALDMVRILEGTEHEIIGACPTNDEAILLDTKSGMGIEVSIHGN